MRIPPSPLCTAKPARLPALRPSPVAARRAAHQCPASSPAKRVRVAARRRRSRRRCRRPLEGRRWFAVARPASRPASPLACPASRRAGREWDVRCESEARTKPRGREGGRMRRGCASGGHEWRRARGWILGAASGREGSAVGGGRVLSDGRLDCSPVVCPSPTRPPSTDVSHSRVGARGGEGGAVRAGVFIRSEGMPRAASLLGLGPPSS